MLRARLATPRDASSLAGIYNQAIEDRTATFETDLRTDDEVVAWFDGMHPIVVVESADAALGIIAFARTSAYSTRACYSGIFEFGVYTDPNHRRQGAGRLAMNEILDRARAAGAWKLVSRVFVENAASRALLADVGFREVGIYHRHAQLDGAWRDVVIVEKFLAPIGAWGGSPHGIALSAIAAAAPPTSSPATTRRHPATRAEILTALRSDELGVRVQALMDARTLIEAHQFPDPELLDAAADALFLVKVHDGTARSRFVDFFRAYAQVSRDAARDLVESLFSRLDLLSANGMTSFDLDAFYEAAFVVRQVTAGGTEHPELTPHVARLTRWMKLAIDLPHGMRTRISPGNLTSLLMNLALSACTSEDEKREVAELATEAKARHRVEPPLSIRSSVVPPPPLTPRTSPTIPPPPPSPMDSVAPFATPVPPAMTAPEVEAPAPEPAPTPKKKTRAPRAKKIAAPATSDAPATASTKKKRAPRAPRKRTP